MQLWGVFFATFIKLALHTAKVVAKKRKSCRRNDNKKSITTSFIRVTHILWIREKLIFAQRA